MFISLWFDITLSLAKSLLNNLPVSLAVSRKVYLAISSQHIHKLFLKATHQLLAWPDAFHLLPLLQPLLAWIGRDYDCECEREES